MSIYRIAVCLSLVCAGLALVACGQEKEAAPEPVRPVKSLVITDDASQALKSYPGRVSANQRVELAFQVAGPLIERPVRKGEVVKKGQLLARIDPRDFQHDLDEEKAKREHARMDYMRYKSLLKTKTVPRADFDEKKAAYEIAIARTATAQKALEDTYLKAPFDGIVSNILVENHENVRAKQPILNLQEIEQVEIRVDIPEQDIFFAEKAKDVSLEEDVAWAVFDALPNKKFPVKIKEYATEADEDTQTYRVTFVMPAPKDFNVFPGMTVSVLPMSKSGVLKKAIRVPVSAVQSNENNQSYVWVIDSDSMTVQQTPVTLGELVGDDVLITGGLQPGQRIVTAGTRYLQAGMEVRLLEQSTGKKQ